MHITQLWRYPVKSLAGESLTSVQVEAGGLAHDRSYALVDRSEKLNGKLLTARRAAAMLSFSAAVTPGGQVEIRTPRGDHRPVDDAEVAAELQATLGNPLTISPSAQEPFHDAYDVLVINAASVRALAREWDGAVNPLRFRPNIIIDGDDLEAYSETGWVGNTFSAGSVTLEGAAMDLRCVLTTIDPQTLVKSPDFLALIVREHDARFGLYCRVRTPGTLSVGDSWTICR